MTAIVGMALGTRPISKVRPEATTSALSAFGSSKNVREEQFLFSALKMLRKDATVDDGRSHTLTPSHPHTPTPPQLLTALPPSQSSSTNSMTELTDSTNSSSSPRLSRKIDVCLPRFMASIISFLSSLPPSRFVCGLRIKRGHLFHRRRFSRPPVCLLSGECSLEQCRLVRVEMPPHWNVLRLKEHLKRSGMAQISAP